MSQGFRAGPARSVAARVVAAALLAAGCYGVVGDAPAGPTSTTTATDSAVVSPLPTATPEPSPTEVPTIAPTDTPVPTLPPAPKPTPKPTPIPWISDGPDGSIDVPFAIYAGTTITYRLWAMPAPATCTLVLTWPDATTNALAKKTATYVGPSAGTTNSYAVSWKITIPASQVGEIRFTYKCTYLGKVRIDGWSTSLIRPPK